MKNGNHSRLLYVQKRTKLKRKKSQPTKQRKYLYQWQHCKNTTKTEASTTTIKAEFGPHTCSRKKQILDVRDITSQSYK